MKFGHYRYVSIFTIFILTLWKTSPNVNGLGTCTAWKAKYLNGSDHCQCMLNFKIITQHLFLDCRTNIGTDISPLLNYICSSLAYMSCRRTSFLICEIWQQGCRVIFIQENREVENSSCIKIPLLSVPLCLTTCSCKPISEILSTVLWTFLLFLKSNVQKLFWCGLFSACHNTNYSEVF